MTPDLPRPGRDGDGLPFADELFSTRPAANPADLRDEMLRQTGHDVPRPPDHPDVSGLREQLGL